MLVVTSTLRQLGVEPRELRDAAGLRQYVMVRHGICIAADLWADLSPGDRHRAFVHGTALMARRGPHIYSHESAAAVWGMPIIAPWPHRVHIVVEPDKARSSSMVLRHEREDRPSVLHDGLLVTPPARTVIDLARDSDLLDAVAAADYSLRCGLCSRADLAAEVELLTPHRPGNGQARLAVELADPLSGSPGESLSRTQMFQLRFPRPRLQVPWYDAGGLIGEVDFDWDWLVGEFDGAVKYGKAYSDSPDEMQQKLVGEKWREDRLRGHGVRMARWGWIDAYDGAGMARLLTAQGLHPEPRREWFTNPGTPA